MENDWDGDYVLGVYRSREAAEARTRREEAVGRPVRCYSVEERTVEGEDVVMDDLYRVFRALGIGARPYSPHEAVDRDLLPRIRQLLVAAGGEGDSAVWEKR